MRGERDERERRERERAREREREREREIICEIKMRNRIYKIFCEQYTYVCKDEFIK